MKDGLRFVDSDMHIMEPPDLFERYLDPKFKRPRHRARSAPTAAPSAAGRLDRHRRAAHLGHATCSSTGSAVAPRRHAEHAAALGLAALRHAAGSTSPIERDYNPEAQVMGMEMEGVDIAVLYPTTGLALIARDDLDPQLSLALCQAYNNWIHEFCRLQPRAAEVRRDAAGARRAPGLPRARALRARAGRRRLVHPAESGQRPLLALELLGSALRVHEELDVTWGFHEGVSALYSHMIALYGENRFYRHVASHWIEMQQALIAMIIGGVFEFHPKLRVGFLEAQNSWVPGLLSRIEWDYPQYRDSHAPYLSLTPKEYFRRNCWAAVEGSEPEIEATAGLIGADRMCVSTRLPALRLQLPARVGEPAEERAARDRRADPHGRRAPLRVHRSRLPEGGRRGGREVAAAPRRGRPRGAVPPRPGFTARGRARPAP